MLVTIIIPIYNVEKYIERCARSLFNQTLENIEFIFIDDCSPDHSIEILQRIIEEYQTRILEKHWAVRIERMTANSGQAAVRKHAIQIAIGDYIINCDSDDWIENNMIQEMWCQASKNNYDIVVCDYNHVGKGHQRRYIGLKSNEIIEYFYEVLCFKSSWACWNKLVKRSLFENVVFPLNMKNMGEDMVLVVQLLYRCKSIGYVNKAFYNYCENSDSITNKKTVSDIIANYLNWYTNICLLHSILRDQCKTLRYRRSIAYLMNLATDQMMGRLSIKTVLLRVVPQIYFSSSISLKGKIEFANYYIRLFYVIFKNKILLLKR